MKKLKPWQIVLLIVFYPVGIIYLIVYLCKKKNGGSDNQIAEPSKKFELTVFVNKGSKVYHSDQMCAYNINAEEMPESKAIKLGLHRCKKCFGNYNGK